MTKQKSEKKPTAKETKAPKPLDGTVKPLIETVTEKLRCNLTEKERLGRLEDQNSTYLQMAGIKQEAKTKAAEYSEKLKERQGHVSTIADELEHGVVKPVKVQVTYDFAAGKVVRKRLDNNETQEHPMMPNERSKAQVNLPLKQQTPGAPVEKADDPKKGKEQEAKPTETPAAEPGDKKKDGEDGFN